MAASHDLLQGTDSEVIFQQTIRRDAYCSVFGAKKVEYLLNRLRHAEQRG